MISVRTKLDTCACCALVSTLPWEQSLGILRTKCGHFLYPADGANRDLPAGSPLL